jgi:hypothetical protein
LSSYAAPATNSSSQREPLVVDAEAVDGGIGAAEDPGFRNGAIEEDIIPLSTALTANTMRRPR